MFLLIVQFILCSVCSVSPVFCLSYDLFILTCSDAPVLVAALPEVLKEDDMSALLSCSVKGEPWPQVNSQIKLLLFL
jgi:hypothetical protein